MDAKMRQKMAHFRRTALKTGANLDLTIRMESVGGYPTPPPPTRPASPLDPTHPFSATKVRMQYALGGYTGPTEVPDWRNRKNPLRNARKRSADPGGVDGPLGPHQVPLWEKWRPRGSPEPQSALIFAGLCTDIQKIRLTASSPKTVLGARRTKPRLLPQKERHWAPVLRF